MRFGQAQPAWGTNIRFAFPSSALPETFGIEHKLAFLSRLLDRGPTADERLEATLGRVADAFDWTRIGLHCPAAGRSGWSVAANRRGDLVPAVTPRSCEQLVRDTADGIALDADLPERRWVAFSPEPGSDGLLWADADPEGGWDDSDEMFLRLAAGMLAGSRSVRRALEAEAASDRVDQRLEDAAFVCGKLAHDLDNLWTGILGFSDLSQACLQPGTGPHQYAKEIGDIGVRGVQITKQLSQFSRSGANRPMPARIELVLELERQRLAGLAMPASAWSASVQPLLPPVAIDPGALQWLLGQLLNNARDACPDGVLKVTAETRTFASAELESFRGNPRPGAFVELTVADSGPGIKPELLPRLMAEPFVTTKVRHLGLGLAIAYRIARAHGAGIRIESGSGTTVRVLLPVSATEN